MTKQERRKVAEAAEAFLSDDNGAGFDKGKDLLFDLLGLRPWTSRYDGLQARKLSNLFAKEEKEKEDRSNGQEGV